MARPKVVVVGGGFGGVYAARRLARADVDLTLLDRTTTSLFQPLLYQCATGLLSEGQITTPLRTLMRRHRNVRVVLGEACDLDATARVLTARRPDDTTFELAYDQLIVAAGMRQSYLGHPEFAVHAPGMKTIDDALAIRRRVLGAFEMAETLPDPADRAEWLTFAVAGGGPTGVELAGQIREYAVHAIEREYRHIDPTEARVLLFDGGDRVLKSFGHNLTEKAQAVLDRLGVETVFGVHVTEVDERGVVATAKKPGPDGTRQRTRYQARTVLWTAGVEAAPFLEMVAKETGATQDRQGRIPVEPDLTVAGHPEVRVVGDVMSLDDLPGVAEVAMQSGRHAGEDARRVLRGEPTRPFRYRDLGNAAYLCRRHALLEKGRFRADGFLGWVLWGVIHIAFLAGVHNRFTTLLNWAISLAADRRGERAYPLGNPTTAVRPYTEKYVRPD
ncbi:NAD(P)/FAD-dependent oxidoreductase [Pseudonocardia sp. RS010]|uniref:NAD(P)/FAD-dependent oxidoreductase n=1 Tax=Pseudonocardia sp. RS010 TaxID=3385979 RepID=UPI00399FF943